MNNNTIKSTSRISKFRFASFYFAAVLIAISLFGLVKNGLNLGLDFTGGYLTEFSTEQPIAQENMQQLLSRYLPADFQLSAADNGTHWSVRQTESNIGQQQSSWLTEFAQQSDLSITPQDAMYIGSQVGDELIDQGGLALLTAVIVILVYLSLRFEWRLAAGSVVALVHDVVIVLGIFAWFKISFDLTIVASLLAIIGYSLNDSIIVGDKVREIIMRNKDGDIDNIIDQAIKSTLVRTLITSGTTIATVLAIGLFAGESLQGFAIALFTGILVGTYSSIAISATVPQILGLTAEHYHKQAQDICTLP
ncbi:protein translocase subunit SecF [Cognaticolwellia beringensis]|uniref:Protein-export membrane protein SecF n=1 Tax=Cognaticolwellia beringensis TaxID=1967665 RepID=A0A222GAA1_9GAMM|nr:protein translocase subunit SecF [Cognaticolwellia beringensis]ASP48809.1 protein translocase subunit SecF [Cognaticolwellia beringensis]